MMVRLLSLGLLLGFLTACAPAVWEKRGATQQDFNVDSYACEKDTRQSGYYGGGIAGAVNMQGFYSKCMVAHGWSARQQTGTRAAAPTSMRATQPSSSTIGDQPTESPTEDPDAGRLVRCTFPNGDRTSMIMSQCAELGGTWEFL